MLIKKSTVEVAVDQDGWNFPPNHPTRTAEPNGKGVAKKYFVIPVEYVLLEDGDYDVSEEASKALFARGVDDITKEINAGLKLALGDVVKSQYRTEGGQKVLIAAMQWAFQTPAVGAEYQTRLAKDAKSANEWLLKAYQVK